MKITSLNIKTGIGLLLCVGLSVQSHAQQAFKISQFSQHNFIYNPAAAGAADYSSVGAAYRTMWSGIDGGPKTGIVFGDHYFEKPNIGASAVLYGDETGPTSRTGGQLNISYSLDFTDKKRLMFGLGVDVLQFKVDMNKISEFIPDDALLASNGSVTKGDASFGIYYRSPKFSGGVSVQNLLQSKLGLIQGDNIATDGKLYRHYYAMANYNIKLDEANVLVPNALIKYLPNAPTEYEVGARFEHADMLWFGFNWCYRQSFNANVGVKIAHKFSIGYSFEQYNTPISTFSDGGSGHELFLRYFFVK